MPRKPDPYTEHRKRLRAIAKARGLIDSAPEAIREARAAGMGPVEISREIGLTYERVWRILKATPPTTETTTEEQ